MKPNHERRLNQLVKFQFVMACYNRILKSGNMEIYLHFADISDMQEKSLHIPYIEVFCGKIDSVHLLILKDIKRVLRLM
jgi:hypothetical protein